MRGPDDRIFVKLADRYNQLGGDNGTSSGSGFRLIQLLFPLKLCGVIETYHNTRAKRRNFDMQATGFMLEGFGLVTCAHCVPTGRARPKRFLEGYRPGSTRRRLIVGGDTETSALCRLDPSGVRRMAT